MRIFTMEIIYENADFLAINKPAGLLVHKTQKTGNESEITLVDNLRSEKKGGEGVGDDPKTRPGIVHRLDRDTSGVIIVAKNNAFFEYFKNLLKTHQVKKTYLALVYGKITEPGIIDKPIGLKSGSVRRTTRGEHMKMVKEAVTEYTPVETFEKDDEYYTLLKVFPKTGRTHQIRVHLASIAHSIVGDELYGKKKHTLAIPRHFLHAESIEFIDQSGKPTKISAPLPEDLETVIQNLNVFRKDID